jgi:hypothetical protein
MDKIKDVKDYIEIMERSYEYYMSLNDKQLKLIMSYKGMYYRILNGYLVDNLIEMYDIDDVENIKQDIIELSKIILNAPKITKDIKVYRGLSKSMESLRIDGKEKIQSRGFISTSSLEFISSQFVGNDCCLYIIKIPKGTPVLPVFYKPNEQNIYELKNAIFDTELELILPPLCTFDVTTKKFKNIKYQEKMYPLSKNIDLENAMQNDKKLKKIISDNITDTYKTRTRKILTYTLKLTNFSNLKTIKEHVDITYDFINIRVPINKFKQISKVKEIPRNVREIPREIPRNVREVPRNVREIPRNVREIPRNVREVPRNVREIPRNVREVPRNVREIPRI